ncbi:hypothetical protein [Microvirga aerilata]|nr:hypothetical protein [Microvirga aerilata]
MRIVGPDIHRAFAEAIAWQVCEFKRIGRISIRRESSKRFKA